MANAFFISETYLKDNSPLSGNVDIGDIYPFAKTAEEIYIQDAIGSPLFDRLVTAVNNQSYTSNERTVLLKIRPALMWYTLYDAIPFLGTKLRNIGIVQQGGENLTNTSDVNENRLRKECKNKADFYLQRLQGWLCENSTVFTEYCCASWNCSELTPNPYVSNSSDLAIDRNAPDMRDHIDIDYVRKFLNNQ